jgi:protein-S-isoprenylcysteine O-methyltransferase Ste14
VRFPPPLLFAGAFLAGWLIQRRWPLAILPREWNGHLEIVGAVLVAAGLLFTFWGLATFHRHRTGIFPHHPATRIVRNGPYRISRNPMYVGLTAAYIGLTLALNDLWPLLFLPVALVLLRRLVIAREERYLSSAFPEDYGAYRQRVRRWL